MASLLALVEELLDHSNLVVLHIVLDKQGEEVEHRGLEVEHKLVAAESYFANVNKEVDSLEAEELEHHHNRRANKLEHK